MRPHSNDTLVLPFSPFPHPRFTGLQERSLHFGRDDVQERRIASHSFSHRFVDPSCAFGAALLQGPTRGELSHMGFHAAYRIVSCSVFMLTRFPTICDYRQTRSPLEKGAAKGRDRRKRQLSNFCVAGEGNCWKSVFCKWR